MMGKSHRSVVTAFLTTLIAATLGASVASAQISPSDMVSGVLQQSTAQLPGSGTYPLYTVPADKVLVLTDISFTPTSFTFGPIATVVNCTLGDGSGIDRWAWYINQSPAQDPPTTFHEWPYEKDFTTGLVFQSGDPLELNVNTTETLSWAMSWSGYLVPQGTVAVPHVDDTLRAKLGAAPNPTNATLRVHVDVTGRTDDAVLAVYDVRGTRIRVLYAGELDAGPHEIAWDGTDDRGDPVGSGVYFVQLATPTEKATTKISRLR